MDGIEEIEEGMGSMGIMENGGNGVGRGDRVECGW